MADERRDIDLVLVTGAGASCDLGVNGTKIAAMKEWSDRLTGALGNDPGSSLLVNLQFGLDGMEFERRLGKYLASARAFRDARDLMAASANLMYSSPLLQNLATRANIEEWHSQVSFSIDQIVEVIRDTLYALFGDPSNRPREGAFVLRGAPLAARSCGRLSLTCSARCSRSCSRGS